MTSDADDVLGYRGANALVVGGATGIGAAAVDLLVRQGATVTVADIQRPSREDVAHRAVDLRSGSEVDGLLRSMRGERHDAVLYCAGITVGRFSDLEVLTVNFLSMRRLLDGLVPSMPTGSAIGVVGSTAGARWTASPGDWSELLELDDFDDARGWCEAHPTRINPAYRISKEAVNAWVAARSGPLVTQGIRLNGINPGPTATPLMPDFESGAGGADVIDDFTKPIGRRATPEEQAWLLLMITSRRASYLVGTCILNDGGFNAAVQSGTAERPAKP